MDCRDTPALWPSEDGTSSPAPWMELIAVGALVLPRNTPEEAEMGGLIYLVGLIVVVLAILSFFGLR